jgi:hypothetical protein
MPMAKTYEIEIVQVLPFEKQARKLFSEDALKGLLMHLALHPEAGDVIKGTNGVRKIRWGLNNTGKLGGARVIYYYRDLNMPLYLLAVYAKGQKSDLTMKERAQLAKMVDQLVRRHGEMTWKNIVKIKIGESA